MFGSPQSLSSRTPSRTPSLHQKNEKQCKSSPKQSSTLDLLSSQLAGMGLHSPQSSLETPSASFTSLSTATSSTRKRTKGLIRHQNRSHVYVDVVCILFFSIDRQPLTIASIKQKWKMINGRWTQRWLYERMRHRNNMVRSPCLTGTAPFIVRRLSVIHGRFWRYSISIFIFSQLISPEYLSYFDRVKSAIPHDSNKGSSSTSCDNYWLKSLRSYLSSSSNRKWVSQASTITCPSLDTRVTVYLDIKFHHPYLFFPRRPPLKFDTLALDVLQKKWRQRDAELEEDLKSKPLPLPSHLPPADEKTVQRLLEARGQIAKFAREAVEDKDIVRLRPGQWLNDEVINFYGALLLCRSESGKENAPKTNGNLTDGAIQGRRAPLNAHYFSSFFWSKLTQDGYEKGRLAKWTKKVLILWIDLSPMLTSGTQIDVFSKDVILIPVNHNNAHWTAAAINFRRKRLESYDSMGMAKEIVFTVSILTVDQASCTNYQFP